MKAVKAHLGVWKVLGDAGLERAAHVHADMRHRTRLATMLAKVAGQLPECRLVPARHRKQQALCVEIIENRDTCLAALPDGLIYAYRVNPGMTFLGVRLAHMMIDHAQQSTRQDPHGRRQHQRQSLQQQGKATLYAPMVRRLHHLAATGTSHSRHLDKQPGFVLEELQMALGARTKRSSSGCAAAPQTGQA